MARQVWRESGWLSGYHHLHPLLAHVWDVVLWEYRHVQSYVAPGNALIMYVYELFIREYTIPHDITALCYDDFMRDEDHCDIRNAAIQDVKKYAIGHIQ